METLYTQWSKIIFFILLPVAGYAQYDLRAGLQDPFATEQALEISGGYFANSNVFTNQFLRRALNGRYISNEDKEQIYDRSSAVNRGGYDLSYSLKYTHPVDTATAFTAELYQQQFLGTSFSEELLRLTLSGNKQYEGETIDIDPLNVHYFDLTGLKIGIIKKLNKNISLRGSINLLRGGEFRYMRIKDAQFHTAPYGSHLEYSGDFFAGYNQGGNFVIPPAGGFGIAGDIGAEWKKNKHKVQVNINDLGGIWWEDITQLSGDSVYRFEGTEIEDIFNYSDTLFSDMTADSLVKETGIREKKGNFFRNLPTRIGINYVYRHSDKLTLSAGMTYLFHTAYVPRVFLRPQVQLNNLSLFSQVAFGGFGKADLSIGCIFKWKKWKISGNFLVFEWLAAPEYTAGQGAFLSLRKQF